MKKHTTIVLLLTLILLVSWRFHNNQDDILAPFTQKAQQDQKNIAIYFSGSDWCSTCHQFKKKVLNTKLIDSLLNHEYVYYNADFPQRKKLEKETTLINEELAEKLNKDGVFPLLVIVDSNWNVKAKLSGNTSEQDALTVLQKFELK